jgi:hypothetical protein
MGNNLNKNYYNFLGLKTNTSEDEIRIRINEIYKEINENNYSDSYHTETTKLLLECEKVLLDNEKRRIYDKNMGFNEKEDYIKVEDIEKDTYENTSKSGKKTIVAMTTLGLTIVVLASVISGKLLSDKAINIKPNNISAKMSISNATNYASSAPIIKKDNKPNLATTTSTEEYTVEKVSSDIWSQLKELQNKDDTYVPELNENNIINLVRWARHEGIVISNADAFGQLMELAENPAFNIADFTKGTDIYDGLYTYTKAFNKVSENSSLIDEDNFINTLDDISDLDRNSVVTTNIVMAEMYANRTKNQEIGLATNTIDGTIDNSIKDTLKTISNEEIIKNYSTYNEFMNSFNNAINLSDQEDAKLKR